MDLSTLTLYLIAGGMSICFCLLLWALTWHKPDALLLKRSIGTILLQAAAFTLSGFGPDLPGWVTVVGTNMAFLASGVVIFAGFAAYCHHHDPLIHEPDPPPDWIGWGMVAATALPFAYWGLVEPNGHARSAVFSFAAAAISGRNAHLLANEAWRQQRNRLIWGLATLMSIVSVWMLARGTMFVVIEPAPAATKGNNPTAWVTVFWYIVMTTLMVACVIWMEFTRPREHRQASQTKQTFIRQFSVVSFFRNKLLALWTTVLVACIGISSEVGLYYAQTMAWEKQRQIETIQLTNDANAAHTSHVFNQVDTVLHAVRSYFQRTRSVAETAAFIDSLPFDKSVVDNVYLIGPKAELLISHGPATSGISLADRDYFVHHAANPGDNMFISAVELGRVTGQLHFRVTRRINHPDGSMAGIVLATVKPYTLSHYYSRQLDGKQNVAALLGIEDHKFRSAAPMPPARQWSEPVDSPLWQALRLAQTGNFRNTAVLDGIERAFTFRQIDNLPLVMVSGFSEADLKNSVYRRVRWAALGILAVVGAILVLASLLTVEIKRRREQDNFMAMLSHELKTPLSVLRMSLGSTLAPSVRTKELAMQAVQDMDTIVYRCLQANRLKQRGQAVLQQTCQMTELLTDLCAANPTPERLRVATQAVPPLRTDPQLLSVALNNLIDNALKYAPPHAQVDISVQPRTHRRQPGVLLCISNAEGSAGMPDPQ